MQDLTLISETNHSKIYTITDKNQQKRILKSYKSMLVQDARQEFLFLKTVAYKGIVKALNYGFDENPWLTLEYVEGQNLSTLSEKPDIKKINDYMLSLSESIAYIHSCGICVNDLSPDNIILGKEGPVLIDLHFATVNLCLQTEFKGTFSCASPEKIIRNTNHFASDIFSLGMIYFYMIHLKTIIEQYDTDTYFNLIKNEDLWNESVKSLIQDEFILLMLSHNPTVRPSAIQVCRHFAEQLKRKNLLINESFIKSYIFKSQQQAAQKLWKKKTLNCFYADEPQKIENIISLMAESERKKLIILDEKLFINNPDEFFRVFPPGYRDKEVYHHKLIDWLKEQDAVILLKRTPAIVPTHFFDEISNNFDCLTMNEDINSEVKTIPQNEISEIVGILEESKERTQDAHESLFKENILKNSRAFLVRLFLLKSISARYKKETYNELIFFIQWLNLPMPLSLVEIIWDNWFTLIQDGLISQHLIIDGELVKCISPAGNELESDHDLISLIYERIKTTKYYHILGKICFKLNQETDALNYWTLHLDYLVQQQYFMSSYEFLGEMTQLLGEDQIPFELKKKKAFIARIIGKFDESLKMYEQLINESDGVMKAVLSTDLAIVLQALKRNEDAIEIYKKAIELFRLHKDWKSLFRAMNNLGVVYFGLKKYTDAESLFNDVLLQSKILNNLQFETISYLNLADINSKRGEWKKAIFHADKAIQIAINNHKWNLAANGKIITAKCLFAQGEFENALDLLETLLEEPQADENQLLKQEIQAWIIHFNIHIHFDKVPALLDKWSLPHPEMHEILIRELFFYYYFNHSYLKANQMAKKLSDNSLFNAFLDSDLSLIANRLKELKIQNENDSYLYYLTWLLQTEQIDSNSAMINDFRDDIKLFDYKPAEVCCNKLTKQNDFSLFFRVSDILESTEDSKEMISCLIKELLPLYHFKRFIYFENKAGTYYPVLLIDSYGREIDQDQIWYSQSIIKQVTGKQGFIFDSFILNSKNFNVSSSIIGLGISSVMAWPLIINRETIGIIYADSKEQMTLTDKQIKLAETIFKMLSRTLEKNALESERSERIQLTNLSDEMNDNWKIIGNSKVMEEVFNKIRMVAAYNVNVLITGPTGSGKELVSRAIHQLYTEKNPASKKAPFVAVNCAAIPEQLLESELFGYKKGAFTGAVSDQKGKILEANYGTIFLDEIGEMPLILQAKLLRVIQDKEVTPLGTGVSIPVTVRIITATNKNLEELVEQNLFRADLFYRLKVMTIPIPALEERREDIPLLLMHFLKKFNQKFNKNINAIQPKTMQYLQFKEWKGNIRELENEIERAVLMCNKDFLSMDDLTENNQSEEMPNFSHLPVKWIEYKDYKQKITDELDSKYASQLLESAGGNISLASKMGNLERAQIYRLMKSKN